MAQRIQFMGQDIVPAKVDGPADVFSNTSFVLVKPSWVSDEAVSSCVLCSNKFNQIRRKHHCRVCGKVLCNKCCKEKIPLPQLGLSEPERVCDGCRDVTQFVTQAYSTLPEFQKISAKGLAKLAKAPESVGKVVELGGMQTLISLVKTNVDDVDEGISAGLHSLSTYPQLHLLLAEAGAIKALCRCIFRARAEQTTLLVDGISALMIFCKSPDLKIRAIEEGALQPVMGLCTSLDPAVSLMAVSTLSLIVEHPGTHHAVIENARDALPRILSLTASSDEQMQEVALKTLCHLSLGTEWHRHRIVQEDFTSGKSLQKAINSRPKNEQILCNAACLIANLATSDEDQNSLHDLLDSLCVLLTTKSSNKELTCTIARALANFAQHPQTSSKVMTHMGDIVNKCLKSDHPKTKLNGVRAIVHLLRHSRHVTIQELLRNGAGEFLDALASVPALIGSLITSLTGTVPERAWPM
ncbi:uncharacterized protein LOC135473959 [Liolophura sinensis]|uniref:uncharacterized protein LOC135473959 n=1 Tax=Liolophura sinensis TaxID=3198878 RepID=UPI00315880BE